MLDGDHSLHMEGVGQEQDFQIPADDTEAGEETAGQRVGIGRDRPAGGERHHPPEEEVDAGQGEEPRVKKPLSPGKAISSPAGFSLQEDAATKYQEREDHCRFLGEEGEGKEKE